MAAQAAQADAPRVPAWKRLGLKLKYAKDTPDQAQSEEKHIPAQQATKSISASHTAIDPPYNKHKRVSESSHEVISPKRIKVDKSKPFPGSAPKTKTAGQQAWDDEDRSTLPGPKGVFKAPGQAAKRIVFGDDDGSTSEPVKAPTSSSRQTRPTTLRKSVSFTPDTKKEDTFSAQTLIKSWASGEDPSVSVVKESSEHTASPPKTREQKKAKKEKIKAKTSANSSAEKSKAQDSQSNDSNVTETKPSYLKYLQQFSSDRSHWKFSKNRQNDLFKHLFDIDRIPSTYNGALVEYISTTQGQARTRIAEQAEHILKAVWVTENENADEMSLDSAVERRLAYYEALKASIDRYQESGSGRTQYGDEQLREVMRQHEQGRRAEELLRKALTEELSNSPSSAAASTRSSSRANSAGTPTTISGATKTSETHGAGRGQYTTTELDLRVEQDTGDAKRKRSRKSRTEISSSSSESESSASSEADSNSDDSSSEESEDDSPPPKKTKPTTTMPPLFDTAVLDKKFGKPITHGAVAAKRRAKDKGTGNGGDSV